MGLLWAMAPPLPRGAQCVTAALGFVLVLALAACLRGRPSAVASCISLGGVWLAVLALHVAGSSDGRGVLAFLVGALGGVVAGRLGLGLPAGRERPPGVHGLVLTAVSVGTGAGLGLFGAWYWQADLADRVDSGWYLQVFTGCGVAAGSMTAVMVWLAAGDGRYKGRLQRDVAARPAEPGAAADRPRE